MSMKSRLMRCVVLILLVVLLATTLAGCYAQPYVAYIDTKGEVKILPNFTAGYPFSEGYAPVCVGYSSYKYWGFIDTKGSTAVGVQYYQVTPVTDGLFAVQKKENGPWQFFDIRTGEAAFDKEWKVFHGTAEESRYRKRIYRGNDLRTEGCKGLLSRR